MLSILKYFVHLSLGDKDPIISWGNFPRANPAWKTDFVMIGNYLSQSIYGQNNTFYVSLPLIESCGHGTP